MCLLLWIVQFGALDLACGNFAQGSHDFLVVRLDEGIISIAVLTNSLDSHLNKQKTVLNDFLAVFDGNTGHITSIADMLKKK